MVTFKSVRKVHQSSLAQNDDSKPIFLFLLNPKYIYCSLQAKIHVIVHAGPKLSQETRTQHRSEAPVNAAPVCWHHRAGWRHVMLRESMATTVFLWFGMVWNSFPEGLCRSENVTRAWNFNFWCTIPLKSDFTRTIVRFLDLDIWPSHWTIIGLHLHWEIQEKKEGEGYWSTVEWGTNKSSLILLYWEAESPSLPASKVVKYAANK